MLTLEAGIATVGEEKATRAPSVPRRSIEILSRTLLIGDVTLPGKIQAPVKLWCDKIECVTFTLVLASGFQELP